jgi:hypothetical protein
MKALNDNRQIALSDDLAQHVKIPTLDTGAEEVELPAAKVPVAEKKCCTGCAKKTCTKNIEV